MNKIIIMGRLTREPEVRWSQGANATAIARISVAVDRKWKREGEPEADFFNCTAFGKQAEFIEKYLHKGTKILISGRIQNDNYTNKDGQKVYSVQIMAEEIEFAESKNAGTASPGQQNAQQRQQDRPAYTNDGFMSIPDGAEEELPFS